MSEQSPQHSLELFSSVIFSIKSILLAIAESQGIQSYKRIIGWGENIANRKHRDAPSTRLNFIKTLIGIQVE
jgi:hypothetical protein